MAVLSAELVQQLARRRGGDQAVVTLYLNVDGKENVRPEDFRLHLEAMIRDVMAKGQPDSVVKDLERIQSYVTAEFERGNSRGLAVFAAGDLLWEVVTLPVPVDDHLVVNMTPHVRSLEVILDEYETIGVLLTDKQRARLLIVELGRITERKEIIDPLPRHDDDGGDWGKDHVKTHATVAAGHHFKHAAQAMFELYREKPFRHLVLGVAEEHKLELEKHLHNYLQQKLVGRCNLPVSATDEDVIAVACDLSQKAERRQEHLYVDKLRAAVSANEAAGRTNGNSVGAVAGLDHTLKAMFERRVDTLLVSEGYTAEGWRCTGCNNITTLGRKCKMCGAEMTHVDDVVEEAVEDALGQSCRVEFCSDSADLDVMGRIGALLRF